MPYRYFEVRGNMSGDLTVSLMHGAEDIASINQVTWSELETLVDALRSTRGTSVDSQLRYDEGWDDGYLEAIQVADEAHHDRIGRLETDLEEVLCALDDAPEPTGLSDDYALWY
jgi:hypothetical protein